MHPVVGRALCITGSAGRDERGRPFSRMASQSGISGLDNSHLLPPYFPAYRGRNLMFGAMVEHLHPHSAVLEYDWCVPHLPLEKRDQQTSPPILSGRGTISLEKIISSCAQYTAGLTPELRLERLEWLLREKAETSDGGLQMIFRQEVAELQRIQDAVVAERLADGLARPQPWVGLPAPGAGRTCNRPLNEAAKLTDIPHLPASFSEAQVLAEFRGARARFCRWAACLAGNARGFATYQRSVSGGRAAEPMKHLELMFGHARTAAIFSNSVLTNGDITGGGQP